MRFYNPDNADLLASEPGARNLQLYPLFVGADVDFIIGGQVAQLPDFRPRLKQVTVPVLVLAGRYDRALYPDCSVSLRNTRRRSAWNSWSVAARSRTSRSRRPCSSWSANSPPPPTAAGAAHYDSGSKCQIVRIDDVRSQTASDGACR